jgi:hypothetical protein
MLTLSDPNVGKRTPNAAGNIFPSMGVPVFALAVSLLPQFFTSGMYSDCKFPEQYALTEASYTMVRLMQRFSKVENGEPGLEEPLIRATLTMSHEKGVKVRLY